MFLIQAKNQHKNSVLIPQKLDIRQMHGYLLQKQFDRFTLTHISQQHVRTVLFDIFADFGLSTKTYTFYRLA